MAKDQQKRKVAPEEKAGKKQKVVEEDEDEDSNMTSMEAVKRAKEKLAEMEKKTKGAPQAKKNSGGR